MAAEGSEFSFKGPLTNAVAAYGNSNYFSVLFPRACCLWHYDFDAGPEGLELEGQQAELQSNAS
jgi:hypothetical protein